MRIIILFTLIFSVFYINAYEFDLYYLKTTTKAAAPNVLFLFDRSGSMSSADVCDIPADPFDELFCSDWYTCANDGDCAASGNKPYENCICDDFPNYSVAHPYCSDFWGNSETPADRNDYEYALSYDMCAANKVRLTSLQNAVTEIIKTLEDNVSEKPINIGISSFPQSSGGLNADINQDVTPLTNISSSILQSKVNALTAGGVTPMGEAFSKVWSYFLNNQSILRSCRPNIVVFTSDGEPNSELSNFSSAIGNNFDGNYETDLKTLVSSESSYEKGILKFVEFMSNPSKTLPLYKDLNDDDKAKCVAGICKFNNKACFDDSECPTACPDGECAGNSVQVFPISFVKNLGIIGEIGKVGNSQKKSYHVGNDDEMISAVFDALDSVYASPVAGAAAPAVTVSSGSAGNFVYLSTFQPKKIGHWWGNIRKYCVFNEETNPNGDCLFQEKHLTDVDYIPNAKENIKELLVSKKEVDGELDASGNLTISSLGVNERLQTATRKIYYSGNFSENVSFDAGKPNCSDVPCLSSPDKVIPDGGFFDSYKGFASDIEVKNYDISPSVEVIKFTATISHGRPSTLYMKLTAPNKRDIYLDHIIIPSVSVSDSLIQNDDSKEVSVTKVIDRNSISSLPDWKKENINGKWTLTIYDRKYGDGFSGKFKSWSLQFFQNGICGDNKVQGHADIVRDTASGILKSYKILPTETCDGNTKSCTAIDNTKFSGGNAKCLSSCAGFDLSGCTINNGAVYKQLVPAAATTDTLKRVYNFMNGYEDRIANTSDGMCLVPTTGPTFECSTGCTSTNNLEADQLQTLTLSKSLTFNGNVDNISMSFVLRREYNNDSPPTFTVTYHNTINLITAKLVAPNGTEKAVTLTADPANDLPKPPQLRTFSFNTADFKGFNGNGVWKLLIKNNHTERKIKVSSWTTQIVPQPLTGTEYFCVKRKNIAGDYWHSSALLVDDNSYAIAGSNTGFLGVFNAATGEEIKAIVPSTDILANHIAENYAKSSDKNKLYGPDITPFLMNGGTFTYIWDASGRGGSGFVVYDKNSLITANTIPLRKFENSGNHNFIMSAPDYISWGTTDADVTKCTGCTDYLVLAAGYHKDFDDNTKTPESSIKLSSMKKGVKWYSVTSAGAISSDSTMSSKTEPWSSDLGEKSPVVGSPLFFNSKIDLTTQNDYNYIIAPKKNVDSLYFVDMFGELFYMNSNSSSVYSVIKIPQPAALTVMKNTEDLNVFTKPAVLLRDKGGKREIWPYIATGDATRPITGIKGNVVVGIKHIKDSDKNEGITNFADFYNATADTIFDALKSAKDIDEICAFDAKGCGSSSPKGWYFKLGDNESVVSNIVAYGKTLFFTVFNFDPAANINATDCNVTINPGHSYLYAINAFNGGPAGAFADGITSNRIMQDLGEGLASEPVLGVDDKGNARLYITKGTGNLDVVDIPPAGVISSIPNATILWWKIY